MSLRPVCRASMESQPLADSPLIWAFLYWKLKVRFLRLRTQNRTARFRPKSCRLIRLMPYVWNGAVSGMSRYSGCDAKADVHQSEIETPWLPQIPDPFRSLR